MPKITGIVYVLICWMGAANDLTMQQNGWQSLMQPEESLPYFMHQSQVQMQVSSYIVS